MNKKRGFLLTAILSLGLLTACGEPPLPDIPTEGAEGPTNTTQQLSNEFTEGYFRTALPMKSSATRGLIHQTLRNFNRHDIEEMELSLMRAATSYFNPDEVFFQEGQVFTRDLVRALLAPQKTEAELAKALEENSSFVDRGLNPPSDYKLTIGSVTETPQVVSHILEQNFVIFDEEGNSELVGASFGIALNPYLIENNTDLGFTRIERMTDEEILERGKAIAHELINVIRSQEELESVELMIGLYVLQEGTSVIPGNLVAKTLIAENSKNIRSWETVNEQFFLLPSADVSRVDGDVSAQFLSFQEAVAENYPHYYGIIGTAHFIDERLHELEITVNIEFFGLAERLSFHQIVTDFITKNFSPQYNITVIIRSTREIHGVVRRPANGDITMKLIGW